MRILRLLLNGGAVARLNPSFRTPYASIAGQVGADEDTVRHRLKKLQECGFLGGWRLQVNPRIWGGGQVLILVDVDPRLRKDDLVETLKLLPGTFVLTSFYERLGVTLEYQDEASLRGQVELVRRLSDAPDAWVGRIPFPAFRVELSARDWDLIRALRSDPRKPYAAVASETGMSLHTVRRRLSRIILEGIAFAWPGLDPHAAGDGVLACLSVRCPSDRAREVDEAITARLGDRLWNVVRMLPHRPGDLQPACYDLALPHILMARDILNWAREVPGVREARVDLHEDTFTNFSAYDAYLDGKLRSLPTTMTGAASNVLRDAAV